MIHLIFFYLAGYCLASVPDYQPQQIHLSFGNNLSEIVVTWTTYTDTNESVVEYGIGGLILNAVGTRQLFVDGGNAHRKMYIHKVRLTDLTSESVYGKLMIFSLALQQTNNFLFQNIIVEAALDGQIYLVFEPLQLEQIGHQE